MGILLFLRVRVFGRKRCRGWGFAPFSGAAVLTHSRKGITTPEAKTKKAGCHKLRKVMSVRGHLVNFLAGLFVMMLIGAVATTPAAASPEKGAPKATLGVVVPLAGAGAEVGWFLSERVHFAVQGKLIIPGLPVFVGSATLRYYFSDPDARSGQYAGLEYGGVDNTSFGDGGGHSWFGGAIEPDFTVLGVHYGFQSRRYEGFFGEIAVYFPGDIEKAFPYLTFGWRVGL